MTPDTELPERRFDRNSWLVLALGLTLLAFSWTVVLWQATLPTDGWSYGVSLNVPVDTLVINSKVGSWPSPLAPDDVVLAVEGQSSAAIIARAFALAPARPANWVAGGTVRYTVSRGGQIIDLAVPIRRYSAGDLLANLFSTGGTSLLIAVFLPAIGLLGVVVFFLRPRYAPARLLFVFAMASLGGFIALGPIGLAELWQPPVFFLYSLPAFFSVWQTAILPVLAHLLLIFPSVKGPLRRYPNVTLALIYVPAQAALWADFIIFRAQPAIFEQVYYSILVVTSLAIIATCVAALAHSFWTVRDPVGRAQLQWVAVGLLGGFMLGALSWLLAAVLGKPDDPVLLGISGLGFLLMPVCLSVAILRFRLFDIAILINRALVYGALTGILAVVFFGSVVLLQSVLALVSPVPNTALVTVLSTLAIAALFAPFRRRLQAIIDRRFNRRKYDAVRALQSFANGARDQVELDSLADSLLSVVDETMSPAHATLWLRSDAPR